MQGSYRETGNFILTCKPSSHKTIAEYLHGAELQEHRQTICKRGKRTTTIYRWLNAVPLRATDDARETTGRQCGRAWEVTRTCEPA
jgi:hypothetical protein